MFHSCFNILNAALRYSKTLITELRYRTDEPFETGRKTQRPIWCQGWQETRKLALRVSHETLMNATVPPLSNWGHLSASISIDHLSWCMHRPFQCVNILGKISRTEGWTKRGKRNKEKVESIKVANVYKEYCYHSVSYKIVGKTWHIWISARNSSSGKHIYCFYIGILSEIPQQK